MGAKGAEPSSEGWRYWLCVMEHAMGRMELRRDGWRAERRERHRIGAREHEEYKRRERGLRGARTPEEKLARMFWHYLAREGRGEIELPRVSRMERKGLEKRYEELFKR